jgi:hypothetical protein
MKTLMRLFTLALLASAVSPLAQAPEKPAPRFALTISEKHEGIRPTSRNILVTETNISNGVITESGCPALRGWYNVSVVYDGVLLEETDAVGRLRKLREGHAPCNGSLLIRETKPGESLQLPLNLTGLYDLSKPGRYEITVTKETEPDHPERNVTVKSNTLTIIVPEPGAAAPQ